MLFVATAAKHASTAQALINAKADVNGRSAEGQTALYAAAQEGELPLINLLLQSNADPDLATSVGSTPLYVAAQNGKGDVAKVLLASNANINAALHNVTTPLMGAISNGHADLAMHFLESGASPHGMGPVCCTLILQIARLCFYLLTLLLAPRCTLLHPTRACPPPSSLPHKPEESTWSRNSSRKALILAPQFRGALAL